MNPKKFFQSALSLAVLMWPVAVGAQSDTQQGLNFIRYLFSFGGLAGERTLIGLIAAVIQLLLFVAGSLAVLFVIIGGYQYITSAGNEERAERAKKTLVNAIIGIVVILLSFVIISVIVNTIGSRPLGT